MRPFKLLSFAAAAFNSVAAQDAFEQWHGPKDGDVRGPCPFMNTFANHGFLPRLGKYITEQDMIDGLFKAVHFNESLSQTMFDFALRTNPDPNSTWFSLDHLARHNVLEHDASLSRIDAYFDHAAVFHQETFDETRSYWGDTINAHNGADAILARINTSNRTNPEFTLSELGENFLIGETGAFIAVLGDSKAGTASKKVVEYLFENERFPTELGWERRDTPLTQDEMMESMQKIREAYENRLSNTTSRKRGAASSRGGHGGGRCL